MAPIGVLRGGLSWVARSACARRPGGYGISGRILNDGRGEGQEEGWPLDRALDLAMLGASSQITSACLVNAACAICAL